ncbi:restriction endonuclease type II-like protein [Jimgerdemannia flammicorona]|uniref:Crossover junction endonuclease MUS81 n=1 Tax=Jimgerdemannia flammicorona TaxID=994334 RepID=A0A433QHR5_9FUNG|nr:restriction endonuclease type II-like protein [Jimgerdemannia flammicorona]
MDYYHHASLTDGEIYTAIGHEFRRITNKSVYWFERSYPDARRPTANTGIFTLSTDDLPLVSATDIHVRITIPRMVAGCQSTMLALVPSGWFDSVARQPPVWLFSVADGTMCFGSNLHHREHFNIARTAETILSAVMNTVKLVVDVREREGTHSPTTIANRFARNGIAVERRTLVLGDFIFIDDSEWVLGVVIERKTVNDLRCSIDDWHFDEQRFRLRHSGLSRIFYIIEGRLKEARLLSAVATLRVADGFCVQQTTSINHTVWYITMLHTAMSTNPRSDALLMSYQLFCTRNSKPTCATPDDVYMRMLMTVRGVSYAKMLGIVGCYPSLKDLMTAYSTISDRDMQHEMLAQAMHQLPHHIQRAPRPVSKRICHAILSNSHSVCRE